MWSALENIALRESLPAPLTIGDTVHDILVSSQLDRGRHNLHFFGQRRSKRYLLKQFYALDTDAFLRWQNEARFIDIPQTPGFIWPLEEWRGGLISPYPGGQTLGEWLDNKNPSMKNRLCVAARIGERIRSLHASGISHRWLSPSTIRIIDHDVVITNFGHAWKTGWDDFWADSPRMPGDMTCSSPELLAGDKCGFTEDIHAFGALLHLLLAGKPPFGRIKQILRAVAPAHISPDRLPEHEDLPAIVRELTTACMAENPLDRPLAEDVAEALTSYCTKAGLRVDTIPLPDESGVDGHREKVMVFIKDDPKAITLFDKVLERAEETPSLFLFVGLIPNNLPSGHQERFKGSLFKKIGQGLARCRAAHLQWSLRAIEDTIPEVAARHLIELYGPDLIMLGSTSKQNGIISGKRGFRTLLGDIKTPVEIIA